MNNIGWLALFAITLLTCAGDYFLKIGSEKPNSYFSLEIQVALVLYASTTYLWCYIMQKVTLPTLGILYASMTVLAAFLLSIFIFKEGATPREYAGAALAIAAAVLMGSK